jgi:hypothetical protein
MRLMIEATPTVTTIDGVPVRLWEGTTEDGIPCRVFVHRIAVANGQDQSAFEQVLLGQPMPDEIRSLANILSTKPEA